MQQEQLTQQIGLFHTLWLIFLVLFILFLLLDIFLFIKLDIRNVIGFLTGKTERKVIQEMMAGEQTGETRSGKNRKAKKSTREQKKMIMTPSGQLKTPDGTGVMQPTGGDITDVLGGSRATDEVHVAIAESENIHQEKKEQKKNRFIVEKEILFVHTDERI